MATTYTAKASVEVVGFQAYADASGAPCTVRVADFAYACDFIGGEVRLSCIKARRSAVGGHRKLPRSVPSVRTPRW
jgi:hypothetical protein